MNKIDLRKFSPKEIIDHISKNHFSMDSYITITKKLKKTNISEDFEFQKKFNGFYIVRRNASWRKIFYDYFEKNKSRKNLSFNEILSHLFKSTGRVEPSFSSKLLATVNPQYPIWDKFVINNLGFKIHGSTHQEKLLSAVSIYQEITIWYQNYLQSDHSKELIRIFDIKWPKYASISDTKKIDTILWQFRNPLFS